MNEDSDNKGHIVFNVEGFLMYWNDEGIEIKVTDYDAKSLKLSWKVLQELMEKTNRPDY